MREWAVEVRPFTAKKKLRASDTRGLSGEAVKRNPTTRVIPGVDESKSSPRTNRRPDRTCKMPTISVRISDKGKKALDEYGSLSDTVREGVRLYLQAKKAEEALAKLRALQSKDRAKTTTLEELKLIREDRNR